MAIPNHPVVEVAFAVLVKAEWKTAICRGSEELSLVELLVHFNAEEEGIVQEEEQPKPEEKFWYHKNIKEVTILKSPQVYEEAKLDLFPLLSDEDDHDWVLDQPCQSVVASSK